MIEQNEITHHVQKHILKVLLYQNDARFRDMRPANVDTNLYSYHLKQLLKSKYVVKSNQSYTLATKGLAYVDTVNADSLRVRRQPKIITMLLIQNSNGEILLQKRFKQPFINTWSLPYGKIHIDDESVQAAAVREASDKLSITVLPKHIGDCYIRVSSGETIIAVTLAHVFKIELDDELNVNDAIQWVNSRRLPEIKFAPGTDKIIARAFFNDPHFFEEFHVDW